MPPLVGSLAHWLVGSLARLFVARSLLPTPPPPSIEPNIMLVRSIPWWLLVLLALFVQGMAVQAQDAAPRHDGQAMRDSLLNAWELMHGNDRHGAYLDQEEQDLEQFLFGDPARSHAVRKQRSPKRISPRTHPAPPPAYETYEDEDDHDHDPEEVHVPSPPGTPSQANLKASSPQSRQASQPTLAKRRLHLPMGSYIAHVAGWGYGMAYWSFILARRTTSVAWYGITVPLVQTSAGYTSSAIHWAMGVTRTITLEILRPIRVLVAAPIIYLFWGFYLVFIQGP